jgi:hypothetical protein
MEWYVSCACADGSRALNHPASIKPLQRNPLDLERGEFIRQRQVRLCDWTVLQHFHFVLTASTSLVQKKTMQEKASRTQADVERNDWLSKSERAAHSPPPRAYHVNFPHETGSLRGRLIAAFNDDDSSTKGDGGLPISRIKSEAADGDYVWIEECVLSFATPPQTVDHCLHSAYQNGRQVGRPRSCGGFPCHAQLRERYSAS